MKKLFIPEYEIDYIGSKPKAFAAAYSDPKYDPDYSEDVSYHEFIDINRIWHDASEEPELNKWIVGNLDKDCFAVAYINSYTRWKEWRKRFGVIRWAYIEELFPNQQKNKECNFDALCRYPKLVDAFILALERSRDTPPHNRRNRNSHSTGSSRQTEDATPTTKCTSSAAGSTTASCRSHRSSSSCMRSSERYTIN